MTNLFFFLPRDLSDLGSNEKKSDGIFLSSRNEIGTKYQQQSGTSGLTAYDTLAV